MGAGLRDALVQKGFALFRSFEFFLLVFYFRVCFLFFVLCCVGFYSLRLYIGRLLWRCIVYKPVLGFPYRTGGRLDLVLLNGLPLRRGLCGTNGKRGYRVRVRGVLMRIL